jgi:hypothetical protein
MAAVRPLGKDLLNGSPWKSYGPVIWYQAWGLIQVGKVFFRGRCTLKKYSGTK